MGVSSSSAPSDMISSTSTSSSLSLLSSCSESIETHKPPPDYPFWLRWRSPSERDNEKMHDLQVNANGGHTGKSTRLRDGRLYTHRPMPVMSTKKYLEKLKEPVITNEQLKNIYPGLNDVTWHPEVRAVYERHDEYELWQLGFRGNRCKNRIRAAVNALFDMEPRIARWHCSDAIACMRQTRRERKEIEAKQKEHVTQTQTQT